MITFTLNLEENQEKFLKKCAAEKGKSAEDYLKEVLEEKIEDEALIKEFDRAIEEYHNDPVTYSHAEICAMFEVD